MSKNKMHTNLFSQKGVFLLILVILVGAAFYQSIFFNWTNDDAFISFRYAENLINGNGLVFNPGEKVEGFSNFLWVITLALFNLLGISSLVISKAISFFISIALILLVIKTARVFGLSKAYSALSALALVLSSSIAYYAMSGLETILYAFLLLLAVYMNKYLEKELDQKYLYALYGVLLAAALTRPEGILFMLFTSLYHAVQKIMKKNYFKIKTLVKVQAPFYLTYGLFIIFRYLYYSDLLPNTYFAKPQGTFVDPGLSALYTNLTKSLLSGSYLLIPILFYLVKKQYLKTYFYPLFFCFIQLIFMSYTGDWMAFGRFFLPALPLTLILFFAILDHLKYPVSSSSFKFLKYLIPAAALILFLSTNIFQARTALTHQEDYPYLVMNSKRLINIGNWLDQNYPESTIIATKRQGAIPFYSKMRSIDLLGLTEKNIARTIYKHRDIKEQSHIISKYILDLEPDIIILFSTAADDGGFLFDRSKPKDKMYYLEYTVFKDASERGYSYLKDLSLGEQEKAYILSVQNNN
jgi:hypothetical protein